jgi:AcrR family transcriptional regulator
MTERGDITRARLIDATAAVVRDVGYAHASIRAIAQRAGVAEGTIYRHFPDKATLFFAAVMERNAAMSDGVSRLAERAGQATVEENLTQALVALASARDELLPLELAVLTDPELAGRRLQRADAVRTGHLAGPPQSIALYLAAEQRLGRVRADVPPERIAIVLLATLFGIALIPSPPGADVSRTTIEAAVDLLVSGIRPSAR